jgi:hypothetical protein
MNMWVKTKTAVRRLSRQAIFAAAIMLTSISVVPFDPVYALLSETSPNPSDVSAGGTPGGVSHLIKKETVANVTKLRLGAYYPTGGAAGKELHIRYGIAGKKCLIVGSIVSGGGNVIVTIDGQTTRTYNIPIGRVCNNVGSPARNNVEGGGSGWGNNKFFADYAFPNLSYDASIGKYYANITIQYGAGVRTGGSDENSVNFQTTIAGDSGNGIVAPLANDFSNEFGLRSAYFKDSPARNVYASTAFGLPCGVEQTYFNVKLFDPDDNVFGETILRVTENGNVLPRARYNVGNGVNVGGWDGSKNGFPANSPSNAYSSVQVNSVNKSKNYRFVVTNYVTPGKVSPNDNVMSVGIPYDSIQSQVDCTYDLNPSLQLTGSLLYNYYPNLTVKGAIAKHGAGVVPESHPWEVYAVRYSTKPATTDLTNSDVPGGACAQTPTANRVGGCSLVISDTYPAKDTDTQPYSSGGPDQPGTRLCFFTRVNNPTDSNTDNSDWRYSNMSCAIAGIKPKVQVRGNDVKIGSAIDTSLSDVQSKTYGSFGEYGVFSNGLNSKMASGSGLLGGDNATQSSWVNLTFANVPTYGSFGGVAPLSYNPGAGTALPLNTLATTTYHTGDKKVLQYSGTLYINGNQTYDNTYSNITQIPNIKIVADNIIIAPGVTRIDPWIVARSAAGTYGNISTCSTIALFKPMGTANLLDSTKCGNQLVFNGPVIANKLYAYRTHDSATGDPAEIFNLNASNWLSAFTGSAASRPVARTDIVTELPPRF